MKTKKSSIILYVFPLYLMTLSNKTSASVPRGEHKPERFRYDHSLQIELMGLGAIYALNYERIIINTEPIKASVQFGCSYLPPSTGLINMSFPLSINQLFSFNKHHIETGIGTMFTFSQEGKTRLRDYSYENFLAVKIGYRYQKPAGRMQYKVLFTPVFEYKNQKSFVPWGGITIGYNF